MNNELNSFKNLYYQVSHKLPESINNIVITRIILYNKSLNNNISDDIKILNEYLPSLRNQSRVLVCFLLSIFYYKIGNEFMARDCIDDIYSISLRRNLEECNEDRVRNIGYFTNPIGFGIYLLGGSPARKRRAKELEEFKKQILKLNPQNIICQQ